MAGVLALVGIGGGVMIAGDVRYFFRRRRSTHHAAERSYPRLKASPELCPSEDHHA